MEAKQQIRPVILLVIEDWHARALIRAQLDEEGFEARSSPAWTQALALLDRGFWPRLSAVIADVGDAPPDDVLARRLALLASHAPVVALTSSFGPKPENLLRMGAQTVLRRPFTVGDVSRALRTLAAAEPVKAWDEEQPT